MRGGRILVAWYSVDFSSTNLTTTGISATLNLPGSGTSATLPSDIQRIDITNTASADGVRVLAGGVETAVVGSSFSGDTLAQMSKGAAITLKSIFGTVSSGKLYIAFYN